MKRISNDITLEAFFNFSGYQHSTRLSTIALHLRMGVDKIGSLCATELAMYHVTALCVLVPYKAHSAVKCQLADYLCYVNYLILHYVQT